MEITNASAEWLAKIVTLFSPQAMESLSDEQGWAQLILSLVEAGYPISDHFKEKAEAILNSL